jgi:thiamine biosynthesis lipoprotein
VSVAAATCVDANVASTAAIVLGPAAVSWLQQHGLPARLVSASGAARLTGGWPAPEPEAA